MKFSSKLRVAGFVLYVLVMLAIVVGATLISKSTLQTILNEATNIDAATAEMFRKVGWEAKALEDMQEQYFAIYNYLPGSISSLNSLLLRVATRSDAESLPQFQVKSEAVRFWLAIQKSQARQVRILSTTNGVSMAANILSTMQDTKQALLKDIEKTFEDYLAGARQITNALARQADQETRLALFEEADEDAKQLIALGNKAFAHGEAIKLLGSVPKSWVPEIRAFYAKRFPRLQNLMILVSLVTVIGLCVVLTVFVYRLMVVPLRSQLVERGAIIEKQRKLAHFGELAAGLAHEIRNPLTAINARLFTLQRSLPTNTAELEDATVIRNEMDRLDRILQDFLQLARPAEPQPILLTAQPLLRDVRNLLLPQMEKHAIQLNLDSTVETQFSADPKQLKQVLINLIQNAAESIEHDGTITLRARDETVTLRGMRTEAVVIEVEDSGAGIPAEVQERLFDPFYSTKEGGTGLGLSISQRIIDKNNGALEFRTQLGIGTTFGIVLPANNAKS